MSIRIPAFASALGAVLICTAGLSAIAHAAEMEVQTTQVSLHGLDLETAAGQAALRHRLRAAVNAVCGRADPRDLQATADVRHCRVDATQAAFGRLEVAIADHHHRPATEATIQMSSSAP